MKLYGGPVVTLPLEKNVLIHARENRKRMTFLLAYLSVIKKACETCHVTFFKFIHGELFR